MFWVTLATLVLLVSAYVFGFAAYQAQVSSAEFDQLLVPRCVDVLVAAWLFWVGSAIGSFLNVVAYRLPRGKHVGGFSACPYCASRIASRDNVPVFGWLALRGRCRRCRLPISMRYPIVEGAVGVTLTLVGIVELYLVGINLPYRDGGLPSIGPLHMPSIWTEDFAVGLYHVTVLSTLWAMALIRFDDQPIPGRLSVLAFAVTVLPMLIWPPLQIVSWRVQVPVGWQPSGIVSALLRVLTGAMAAGVLARAIGQSMCPDGNIKLNPLGKSTRQLLDLTQLLAVAGILVGWQAIPLVALIASGLAIVLRRPLPTAEPLARFAVALPVALCLQVVGWRWIDSCPFLPGTRSAPWVMIGHFLAVLVLALWLKPIGTANPAAKQVTRNHQGSG